MDLTTKFIQWLSTPWGQARPAAPAAVVSPYPPREIERFLHYFGIGERVSVYPEARPDLTSESLILGYAINKHSVFSRRELAIHKGAFTLGRVNPVRIPLQALASFHFLVPCSPAERKGEPVVVDGPDEEVGPDAEAFATGSSVVLSVPMLEYGIPTVETTVLRSLVLQEGLYAGQTVLVLEPRHDSFLIVDRRRHRRIRTHVPVMVKPAPEATPDPCIIADFSENHLRVKHRELASQMLRVGEGDRLEIALDMPEQSKSFRLTGVVYRRVGDALVVRLTEIFRNGGFVPIRAIEELEIKAALLNHPNTNKNDKKA